MRAINLGDQVPSLVGVMILLDRSGSMKEIQAPMEEQFQVFLAEQRAANPDGMWVSVHQFDTRANYDMDYDVMHDRTPLAQVTTLGLQPRGWSPVRDALVRFAQEARKIIDDPQDVTERLLLVVITDGQDNRSRNASWADVRELMQGLESAQVETIWLGTTAAVMEVHAEMQHMRDAGSTVAYDPSAVGVAYAYGGLRSATMSMRSGGTAKSAVADYAADADMARADLLRERMADRLKSRKP